jgi:hypothetical protein
VNGARLAGTAKLDKTRFSLQNVYSGYARVSQPEEVIVDVRFDNIMALKDLVMPPGPRFVAELIHN